MGFSYEALTEQEAQEERYQLLKEGEYDAVITTSSDTISSNSGNQMMDMTVSVFDDNGKSHDIRDFLVFTKTMMWKVIHCANSAGLLKEYEDQNFCSEVVIGKRVRVNIAIEAGSEVPIDRLKGRPLGSKYPDKNKIADYVKKEDKKPLISNKNNDIDDDDIAF